MAVVRRAVLGCLLGLSLLSCQARAESLTALSQLGTRLSLALLRLRYRCPSVFVSVHATCTYRMRYVHAALHSPIFSSQRESPSIRGVDLKKN